MHTLSRHHLLIGCLAVVVVLSACAANRENQKKQAESNKRLGEEYVRQGNHTAGLKYLLSAESEIPDDPELQNVLGYAYMGKGHLDTAVVHFKRALELKREFPEALNNLGVAYMRKGDWASATPIFKQLTNDILYPTPQFPLFNLGWVYYKQKDYQRSETYYLEALKVSPNFIIALRGLGLTYTAMGNGPKAVRLLEKAISLAPNTAQLYFDLADAYIVSGNILAAQQAYLKVIVLEPDGELATEAKKAADRLQ